MSSQGTRNGLHFYLEDGFYKNSLSYKLRIYPGSVSIDI